MSAHAHPRAIGGKLLDRPMMVLLAIFGVAALVMAWRFVFGVGAVSNMTDGFTWGIWEPVNVVVFTGIGAGAYGVGLLCYLLNKGEYHWLVRPAVLVGAISYTLGGSSIMIALGRYWNALALPIVPWWNLSSVLLEVAVCVMSYIFVLWVEVLPSVFDGAAASKTPRWSGFGQKWGAKLAKIMPYVIALAILLPTMHQSSLGGLMLLAVTKVHPLWHTGLLPLLFLLSAFAMGYAIIFFEAIFSAHAFRRSLETKMLARLGAFVAGVIVVFLAVRFSGLFAADRLGLTVRSGGYSFFFWAETLLLAAAAFLFLQQGVRASAAAQLQAALLALAGGTLYRIDAFLTAYRPGQGWVYFPSFFEILVTLGIVATETVAYVWLVRRYPILVGVTEPKPEPGAVPVAVGQGVSP